MLNGLMMDDFQLSLTVLVERAERLNAGAAVVSRRPDGSVRRTSLGECAQRARRLASGLADLGIGDGDRVADAAVEPDRASRALLRAFRSWER